MRTIRTIFNHQHFWAILFCAVPISLILLAGYLELSEGGTLVILIIGLLALHFIMPIGRDILHDDSSDKQNT